MAHSQIDQIQAKDQLQALQAMLKAWGPEVFMAAMFWILVKEVHSITNVESSRVIPFRLNRIQKDIELNIKLWNLLLKPRQTGGTTYFLLRRLFLPAIVEGGIGSLLISQSREYAGEHFQIVRRAYNLIAAATPNGGDGENLLCTQMKQGVLHTAFSNRRELVLDYLDSKIRVATAEVEESGQGLTLHHIVASEYARWPGNPENTLSNVMGALVNNGTLDRESTGNGAAGPFYEACLRAMNSPAQADAKLHFYPWWWDEGYSDTEFRFQEGATVSLDDITPKMKEEIQADLESDEKKIIEAFHLDLNQIAWRRKTRIAQRGNFDEKYPEDPITAFLVSGKQYFDKDILIARKRELVSYKPLRTYDNGSARIFKGPIPGRRYVIGADVATGRTISNEDTDYCAAVVIDLETGEEKAAYRARVTPQDFALDLDDLGRWYNNAIIAVERTGDGGTTILTLQGECKYGAIYKHREWHKRERKKAIEFEGFPTTGKTRPIALNCLSTFVLEHPELIWDAQFIDEALVFVRDEKGIPAATTGAHDDTVSCRWIAYQVRRVLLGWWDPLNAKSERYTPAEQLTTA